MGRIVILCLFIFSGSLLFSQNSANEMLSLSQIKKDVKTRRVGSFDQTGGNGDCLTGIGNGEKRVIMDVKGSGIINHIWITIAPEAAKANRNAKHSRRVIGPFRRIGHDAALEALNFRRVIGADIDGNGDTCILQNREPALGDEHFADAAAGGNIGSGFNFASIE